MPAVLPDAAHDPPKYTHSQIPNDVAVSQVGRSWVWTSACDTTSRR